MKLIELHFKERPYSINPNYIVAINPLIKGGCEVFTVGDKWNDAWNTDESYEEILQKIREVSNETG